MIYILLRGGGEDPGGKIHRRGSLRHALGIFDLKTVERVRPIFDFLNAQVVVGVFDNFGKRRHWADCSGVCVKRRNQKQALAAASASTRSTTVLDESGGSCDVPVRFSSRWNTPTLRHNPR